MPRDNQGEGEATSFIYAKVTKAQKWAYVRASRTREGRPMRLADWVTDSLDAAAKGDGVDPADFDPNFNRIEEGSEDSRFNR